MSFDRLHLEELATGAEDRAGRAREHALEARERAGRADARGDHVGAALYRREADTHERAAHANEQTAALYRRRVRRVEVTAGDDAAPAPNRPRSIWH